MQTESSLAIHSDPRELSVAEPPSSSHKGSASPNLSGGRVLLAWLLSIGFHVAGLGGMYLVVFPYVGVSSESQPAVTFARLYGEIDAAATAPTPTSAAMPPTEAIAPSSSPAGFDQRFAPNIAPPDQMLGVLFGGSKDASAQSGGLGGVSLPGMPIIGLGGGTSGGGGDAGKGGLGLGGGAGPEFFGLSASGPGVRTIVYVVDRSGSMLDTFPAVRAELKRSISALRRSQKFHVIFYNSGDPVENPPMRLVNAVDANKREFFEFLETVTPYNGTHPDRAMRRALALEPDVIYFLSDGLFDAELVDRLDEWNRARRTKIYTIAYVDQGGRRLLETIARQHGGEFKFVTEDELP